MAANPTDSALPAQAPRGFAQHGMDRTAVQAKQIALIDQMIQWQLANPGKPWSACAAVLKVTPVWCRMMASTDAFQARYREASDRMMTEVGLFGIRERITAAAEIGLERLAEKLAVSESVGDITDATDMLLKHQYGVGGAGVAPTTSITIQQQLILEGREAIMAPKEPAAPIDATPLPKGE